MEKILKMILGISLFVGLHDLSRSSFGGCTDLIVLCTVFLVSSFCVYELFGKEDSENKKSTPKL